MSQPSPRPHKFSFHRPHHLPLSPNLHKYSPKYLHTLSLPSDSSAINHKSFKSLKSLSHISFPKNPKNIPLPLLLRALKPHKKSIKCLSTSSFSHIPHINKVSHYLPNLSTFHLTGSSSWKCLASHNKFHTILLEFPQDPAINLSHELLSLQRYIWRIAQSSYRLRSLQHLTIKLTPENKPLAELFLSKLANHPHFFTSLQTFHLSINVSMSDELQDFSCPPSVFPFITHLSLKIDYMDGSLIDFSQFPNLKDLQIQIINEEQGIFKDLATIQGLQKLQSFLLKIAYKAKATMIDFLTNFSLPTSLTAISFEIYRYQDCEASPISNPAKNEERTACINFFSKWKGLNNLKDLKFIILDEVNWSDISGYFVIYILKQLTAIENLVYQGKSVIYYNYYERELKAFELSCLLESLSHLSSSLKSLDITSPIVSSKNVQKYKGKFPKLANFSINGEVEYEGFEDLVTILATSVNPITARIRFLSISPGVLGGLEALLRRVKVIPEGVEIFLEVYFEQGVKEEGLKEMISNYMKTARIEGRFELELNRMRVPVGELYEELKKNEARMLISGDLKITAIGEMNGGLAVKTKKLCIV